VRRQQQPEPAEPAGVEDRHVTVVAHEVHEAGGQERATLRLCEGLLDRGFLLTVVSRRCDCRSRPRLRIVRVPGPRRPALLGFLWFFFAGGLITAVRRRGVLHVVGAVVPNRADVVTAHFCHTAFERARAAHSFRRASRPGLFYRAHELLASAAFRLAERLLYHPAAGLRTLVAVSAGLAAELEASFPRLANRMVVIPNGVDSSMFGSARSARHDLRAAAPTRAQLVALFVGGDWERKGLGLAVESIARSAGWCLWVVGSGDVGRYEQTARACGAEVWFAGTHPAPADFYAAADAFILPSAYETFSLAALEAAAAELPLVLSPVSGVRERVRPGVEGFVVSRDASALSRCLDELRDPMLRARMGTAARRLALEFDWTRVIDAYEQLYERRATSIGLSATRLDRAPHAG
jgi:UDP-glucose:(heptosyl)LPS alpha-1,3-glucosyltransferase